MYEPVIEGSLNEAQKEQHALDMKSQQKLRRDTANEAKSDSCLAQTQAEAVVKRADALLEVIEIDEANAKESDKVQAAANNKAISDQRIRLAQATARSNKSKIALLNAQRDAHKAAATSTHATMQHEQRIYERGLEMLQTKAEIDKQNAAAASEQRDRQAKITQARRYKAWLITPAGLAKTAAKDAKARRKTYDRLRAEEVVTLREDAAAARAQNQLAVRNERRRLYGEAHTTASTATTFITLLLLVTSGTVDLYLMWHLRPTSTETIGMLFAAWAGTTGLYEILWFTGMCFLTVASWSSGYVWYGTMNSAEPRVLFHYKPGSTRLLNALYLLKFTAVFLCCALPIISTYAILLLFIWDTFVCCRSGVTCPPLVPGFSSRRLSRGKLETQGLFRVAPSIAFSGIFIITHEWNDPAGIMSFAFASMYVVLVFGCGWAQYWRY